MCETLSPIVQIDPTQISSMIERVHRGPRRQRDNNNPERPEQPRVIHAKLFNWNHVENLKKLMWKHGKKTGIYIDQHFGPNTTYRRNKALEMRRDLMKKGDIAGGYLRYPAKLFVKRHSQDTQYVLHRDFSNIPVPLPLPTE